MRSKRVIELCGIVLVLFGVLTIISTGNSISVCDTLQPKSICKETMGDRQLQLAEDSDNNDSFDEFPVNDDNTFVSGHIRRKRLIGAVLSAVTTGVGAVTSLFGSIGGQEKPKQQENTALLETNAKLNSLQNTIRNNLEDIRDMNAQLSRNQRNLGSYVTGMDSKLSSIQNSLGTITLINGRLDRIESSQDSNKKAITVQLQNVQKNLDSIREMNEKLNSNHKSLDDYVKRIVTAKIDTIQKSLGDYMSGANVKLDIIQNNLEDIKDVNTQLSRNQKNLANYVTGMDAKLSSIQNSLGTVTLINGRLDKIEYSQENNKKAMTGQLQNVQKNLDSIKELNEKLNSNQKSLDDYVRGIVNSKIDSIQKSLGDFMEGVNGKLDIIQKAQEENSLMKA